MSILSRLRSIFTKRACMHQPTTGTRMERGFRHEVLVYHDADEFLGAVVPFLEEGLEAGEPALVALGAASAGLLQAELGAAAAEMGFADMEAIGRNPARIVPFWGDFVDEHGEGVAQLS